MAGIRDVFHTEDPCVIVNNVFLIPCCEARRVDSALFFAFGVQFVQSPTLALFLSAVVVIITILLTLIY